MAKAVVVGGGVIGGGWAARFLLNGWDVTVVDPDPQAERKIAEVLANARRSLPGLYDGPLPDPGALTFSVDLAQACANADWVQESVPERLEIKHSILAAISAAAPDHCVIGSSTSGFKPSQLTAQGARVIVAHPFNPVYLLPLIELVGHGPDCCRAAEILKSIGMFPLKVRKEIDAHIADRFLEAVWREALWLVKDGVATTEEIDEAIRMGFGLRWAQMGLFETYRVAGGEAGMAHFMAQFGPALKWPWTKLMDVPDFTDELVDLIAGQSDAQSGHLSIRELERLRDDNLVGILRALKQTGSGAGGVISDHQATLALPQTNEGPPITMHRQIPQTWVDYNGHMNEARYMEAASVASDFILEEIGAGLDYVATTGSYFTLENHIRYLAELRAGQMLTLRTRVLAGEGKTLHIFHELTTEAGLAATVETLLIHVDMATRRAAPPPAEIANKLSALVAAHAQFAPVDGAGRVGRRTP